MPGRRRAQVLRRPGTSAWRAVGRTTRLIPTLVSAVATAACIASVVALLLLAVGPHTGAYRTVTMLTGSMRPTYPVGTILIDTPTATADLRPGQVLTYQIPIDDHRVVSHRILTVVHPSAGVTLVQTKGDANNGPDPWKARITDRTVWTVRGRVPALGSVLLWLRQPSVLTVIRFLLPAALLVWVLYGVWAGPTTRRGRHAHG
jgi:signal peptidase